MQHLRSNNTFKKRLITCVILLVGIMYGMTDGSSADVTSFSSDGESTYFTEGKVLDGYSDSYKLSIEGQLAPSKVMWNWETEGKRAWAQVQYSDRNMIYFVMEGTQAPQAENLTFIDSKGVPQIVVPKVLTIPSGKVVLNLSDLHHKYFGARDVSVEGFKFMIDSETESDISEFVVLERNERKYDENSVDSNYMDKKICVELQIPQGNKQKYYMLKNETLPVEVTVKALLDKKTEGQIRIQACEGFEIISYPEDLTMGNDNALTHDVNAPSGYYEKKIVVMAKSIDLGSLDVSVEFGNLEERSSIAVICKDLVDVKNGMALTEDGVYTYKTMTRGHVVNKNFKNSIRLKQNIFSAFHQIFGLKEDHSYPAGVVSGLIRNDNDYDVPVRIKFAVLDQNGIEVMQFRGEHIQREGEEFESVPETNVILKSNDLFKFSMPVYADVYSIKPGQYTGEITIDVFGSDIGLIEREFELNVQKESQIQKLIGTVAIIFSLFAVMLLIVKQKVWLSGMRTREIMIIALFTTVKFSLVDVSWFVMGDVIRAILGPLGPFMHIITGIFWDVINSVLLVALIYMVRRPGVVIISSVVRVILKGIAFGSFNPIAILLILSYSLIADGLLYVTGFTSGKTSMEPGPKVFMLLGVTFGLQHLYSTYAFYYIWMYLYRLYYPTWYINVNALLSVVYSIVGAISGLYLGRNLSKVVN